MPFKLKTNNSGKVLTILFFKKINTQVGQKLNEKSSNGSGDLGLRTIALSCESSLILVDYLVDKHIIYLATCQTFYCEINFINLHWSFNIYIDS